MLECLALKRATTLKKPAAFKGSDFFAVPPTVLAELKSGSADGQHALARVWRLNVQTILERPLNDEIACNIQAYIDNMLTKGTNWTRGRDANDFNLDVRTCKKLRKVSAETGILIDRSMYGEVDDAINASTLDLIQALDIDLSDETPMKVNRKDLVPSLGSKLQLQPTPIGALAIADEARGSAMVAYIAPKIQPSLGKCAQMSKILQSFTNWRTGWIT